MNKTYQSFDSERLSIAFKFTCTQKSSIFFDIKRKKNKRSYINAIQNTCYFLMLY